jgi:hypothetical protein
VDSSWGRRGLLAIAIRRITPDTFGIGEITKHFVMVVLGGLGSIVGSVIGAIMITILPEFLRGIQTYQEVIYGVTIILFVFLPLKIMDLSPNTCRECRVKDSIRDNNTKGNEAEVLTISRTDGSFWRVDSCRWDGFQDS